MKKYHISMINIPAYGHVNPTLALVEKLCEKVATVSRTRRLRSLRPLFSKPVEKHCSIIHP